MTNQIQTIAPFVAPAVDPRPLAWAPQVATLLAAFAILFAMPIGPMLTLVLMGATAAGIGIAELRRHGGQGMPVLPYALED